MATKRLTVKSYLTEKEFETVLANSTKAGLRRLLREIEKTRLEIKEKVREINDGKRH